MSSRLVHKQNLTATSRMAPHALLLAGFLLAALPGTLPAQRIVLESELPRTLVFIAEEGDALVASRDMTDMLRRTGFPVVDPALAHTAAQRELVRNALEGDEGAAVQLGRDFGAQILILGRADWGTRPDPVDGSLITATAEVEIRALRMDIRRATATSRASSRKIEATEQAARTAAIRGAVDEIITHTPFLGRIINSWEAEPWSPDDYFPPDPGSIAAEMRAPGPDDEPRIAVLHTGVAPPATVDAATRGIGVVRRDVTAVGATNQVTLEGIVLGPVTRVTVEDVAAEIKEIDAATAERLGAPREARLFQATTALPVERDTLRIVAESPSGTRAETVVAPRVRQRWAVIIGVGEYESPDIADLAFAPADARAIHDFVRSPEAGPFPPENVLLLTDRQATGRAMREALFVFLQQARWDDLVLIYFAGHGAPDPHRPDNLYLLPNDADLNALAATGFPMWDVKTALRRQIEAERVIVIADACHAGGTREGLDNPINGSFMNLFTPSRRLTLSAADTHELSYESARWGGHGAFTYFLLEALRGKGDADGDGIVTFSEAAAYVQQRVPGETGGRQNPQRTGLGDVPLSVVPPSR